MKDRPDIQRILRIIEMEGIFDYFHSMEKRELCHNDRDLLQRLVSYYASPLWRQDYEADERGELPKGLKRGILSQDALYDFLTDHFPRGDSVGVEE